MFPYVAVGVVVLVVVLFFILIRFEFGRDILRELLNVSKSEEIINYGPLPDGYLSEKYPYHQIPILSDSESSFYQVLKHLSDDNFIIFAKVRLGDIVNVDQGEKKFMSHWGKIKSRHVDFLLCDEKLNYICVVELDDSSHKTQKQQVKDEFLDSVLETSGIRIVRQKAQRIYDVSEIKKELQIY